VNGGVTAVINASNNERQCFVYIENVPLGCHYMYVHCQQQSMKSSNC